MSDEVALLDAAPCDAALLANLLELYAHDLSEVFPIEPDADGRFGYAPLPLYWSEPDRRFPFLIHYRGRLAGFVLITRGSPVSDDPAVHDIAEFFVLRRYRRSGVGRRAAFLAWDHFPGGWTVRIAEGNTGALRFWPEVISEYTGGRVTQSSRPGWRVFTFSTSLS